MKNAPWRAVIIGGLAIAACGSDAADAMRAAGETIADAGRWLADAGKLGGDDAAAQSSATVVHEGTCTALYEWTETNAGSKIRYARLYFEVNADTSGVTGATALLCGKQPGVFDFKCPNGATCTGQVDPPRYDCENGFSSVQIGSGKLRTLCGAAVATGDAPLTWTYRWDRARIALHR